jgi:ABC-type transport system involved in multi-copper enzyme maturation permease subunit
VTIALTATATQAPIATAGPGRAGFRQAFAAEWTKLMTLRSTKWILAITAVGTLLVTFLSTHSVAHKPPGWYQGFDPTNQSLAGLSIGALALGVLGVLTISGEYGTGTIRSSLSAVGRRETLLMAKLAVVAAVTLVLGEVLSFGAFFFGQAILSSGGAPTAHLGQPGVLRALVLTGAFLSLFALLGFGLGLVIRHSAGALATFAGVALLAPILLQTVAGHPDRYTPAIIFANSVAAVVPQAHQLSATIGFMLMVLYCLGVLVAGAVLLTKRDA